MAVDVFAADEQSDRAVDIGRWAELARDVLGAQGVKDDIEVSLLFVDEPTIAELHERFLGEAGPTDVLAFPIDEEPEPGGRSPDEGGTGPGGGCPRRGRHARRSSATWWSARRWPPATPTEHGVSFEDEMALLVVHGLLHLLGHGPRRRRGGRDAWSAASASCWPASTGPRGGSWSPWPVPWLATARFRHHRLRSSIAVVVVLLLVGLGRPGPGRDEPGPDEPGQGHGPARTTAGAGSGPLRAPGRGPRGVPQPVLLLVLICQLVTATLVGILAERLVRRRGGVAATVFEVVVIFVLAEALPKNWAVQNPERSALLAGPHRLGPGALPARPVRSRSGLIGLANLLMRPPRPAGRG